MKVAVGNISRSEEKFKIGKELVQEEEFERADFMLKKAIRLNPKNAEVYFWLGVTLYNNEDYERAIFILTKCIELAPDN